MASEEACSWFVSEIAVQDPIKLHEVSGGAAPSSSSSTSSLEELEVSRLAAVLRRIPGPSSITAVDYCRTRARFVTDLSERNLVSFLSEPRPVWSAVRWLVVDGVSGAVLQALAEAYDLHPLAIEDTLTFQRIKAVSFPGHLFVTAHAWQLLKQRRRRRAGERGSGGGGGKRPKGGGGGGGDQQQRQQQQQQEQQEEDAVWRVDVRDDPLGGGGGDHGGGDGGGGCRSGVCTASRPAPPAPPPPLARARTQVSAVRRAVAAAAAAAAGAADGASSAASSSYGGSDDGETDDEEELLLPPRLGQGAPAGGGPGGRAFELDRDERELEGARAAVGGCHHGVARGAVETRGERHRAPPAPRGGLRGLRRRRAAKAPDKPQQQQQGTHDNDDDGDGNGHAGAAAADGVDNDDGLSGTGLGLPADHAAAAEDADGDAAAAGAGAGARPPSSSAAAAAAATMSPRLVVPLHACAFRYRPTRSPFKRRRVVMSQISSFLTHDGVLVTVFPGKAAGGGLATDGAAGCLMRGLRGMSSLLLESEDASFLLQALLRSVIAHSLPVFGRLSDLVQRLDARVLEGRARISLTRRLHVLFVGLTILARSYLPMTALLQTLAATGAPCAHGGGGYGGGGGGGGGNKHHGRSHRGGDADGGDGTSSSSSPASVPDDPFRAAGTDQRQQQQQPPAAAGAGKAAPAGAAHPLQRSSTSSSSSGSAASTLGSAASSALLGSLSSAPSTPSSYSSSDAPVVVSRLARTYLEDLVDQSSAIEADLAALAQHVAHLSELVVVQVGHSNANANTILAIIATLFLPLSFLTGLFGMNFSNMGELDIGYPTFFYSVCAAIVVASLLLMWWLGIVEVSTPKWLKAWRRQRRQRRRQRQR